MNLDNNDTLVLSEFHIPIYSLVFAQFFHPLVDLFGIIGNIWILVTLAFGRVSISHATKFYYSIIGLSDLSIVLCNFLWTDLCDALWIWTEGKTYFCFDILSLFSCIITNLWGFLSELVSNYALVALSIERLIAVCFPFRAKSILNRKFTLYLLLILIGPSFLLYSVVIPLSSAITPYIRVIPFICYFDYSTIFGIIFKVSMPIIILGIHTIVDLIVSLIIFFKLYFINKNSALISKPKTTSKELSATLTLLFLCAINIIIYGICLVSYVATVVFSYWVHVSDEILSFSYTIFYMFITSTALPHSINILVYLALIPPFRRAAFCNFFSSKNKQQSISSANALVPSQ